MTNDSGLQLAQGARYWRLNPDMFRRKNGKPADPALAQAQVHAEESLIAAKHQRDRERAKLIAADADIAEPLRRIRRSNHLSELAVRALRGDQ